MSILETIHKLLSNNEREIKRFRAIAETINTFEAGLKPLSNEQLKAKTAEFRKRIADGETLEQILPEAFAVVRESSIRTLGLRHFDVQMIGGMVLHEGRIAEMRTGEGKTLVATLPLYLNALSGHGAHLVTVNDYLSKRDAAWNGPVFELLGLTIGSIHGQSAETGDMGRSFVFDMEYVPDDPEEWALLRPSSRKEAYDCDITYGTNHEFGFDYLRDNMAFRVEDLVQRELNFAIVDEVDSILIDEARTPLIISGHGFRSSDDYYKADRIIRRLVKEVDYTIDEKAKTAMLTEEGTRHVEEITGCGNLNDSSNNELNQYINSALKAHGVFRKDIDYVVKDGQVTIVDEFTGRLMFGRRWSDGLHQAVEAKEGCNIEEESQTLATITYQNYFRLYKKLGGMTGTAKTEEEEFRKIYGLDVLEVPTNRAVIRKDMPDVIYKSEDAKFRGILLDVIKCHAKQQPVLVGTRSIEVSERVSERLLSERLQLLALTEIMRVKLDNSKGIDGETLKAHHALLNSNFNELTIPKVAKLAKQLEMSTEMLSDENIAAFMYYTQLPDSARAHLCSGLKEGIEHKVLNAKYHEREAEIISQAGRKGAVTIATNMAGRGVDIILGGTTLDEDAPIPVVEPLDDKDIDWDFNSWKTKNPDKFTGATPEALDVIKRGGLCIVGTERHESRRIDNQLRGRSGRQGDPGATRFFVSLEDELWRLFGDKSQNMLLQGWREDQALDARLLSRVIERAQKKVEMHHFDMRKHVLDYDDVMNVQRETIYKQRREILNGADLRPTIVGYLNESMEQGISMYWPLTVAPNEWDNNGLYAYLNEILPIEFFAKPADFLGKKREDLQDYLEDIVERSYQMKEQQIGEELMREMERNIALDLINRKWIDHLGAMDFLREGVGLRGYAQRDPLVEYRKEGYDLFQQMIGSLQDDLVRIMYRIQMESKPVRKQIAFNDLVERSAEGPAGMGGDVELKMMAGAAKASAQKPGRNDLCPCGSGKKYKKCCLGKEE